MLNLTEDSSPFITGMGYRKKCDLIYDEFKKDDLIQNQFKNCKIFIKTDYLHFFISNILPYIKNTFILYSHNSDLSINASYNALLDNFFLKKWYAQNVLIKHEKLFAIPIGLANKRWEHGNIEIFKEVLNLKIKKEKDFYFHFNEKTNLVERKNCLSNVDLPKDQPKIFKEYLKDLSKSYFSICPSGNGLDTHRVWESIYFKTIPIVTHNETYEQLSKKYPILMIDKWENFKHFKEKLNKEYYFNFSKNENFSISFE